MPTYHKKWQSFYHGSLPSFPVGLLWSLGQRWVDYWACKLFTKALPEAYKINKNTEYTESHNIWLQLTNFFSHINKSKKFMFHTWNVCIMWSPDTPIQHWLSVDSRGNQLTSTLTNCVWNSLLVFSWVQMSLSYPQPPFLHTLFPV